MGLGYDVEDSEVERFQSDTIVTKFTKTVRVYPYINIITNSNNKVKIPKLQALKGMFATVGSSKYSSNSVEIYISDSDINKTQRLGKISVKQVNAFLLLFDIDNLEAYLSEEQKLEGDYIYVLCG